MEVYNLNTITITKYYKIQCHRYLANMMAPMADFPLTPIVKLVTNACCRPIIKGVKYFSMAMLLLFLFRWFSLYDGINRLVRSFPSTENRVIKFCIGTQHQRYTCFNGGEVPLTINLPSQVIQKVALQQLLHLEILWPLD